jgi:splicing factor 3B subunit 3
MFATQYKRTENVFYVFADEAAPRYLSASLPLDYDTVAVADKFGNFGVLRLPADVSQQVCVCVCVCARACNHPC